MHGSENVPHCWTFVPVPHKERHDAEDEILRRWEEVVVASVVDDDDEQPHMACEVASAAAAWQDCRRADIFAVSAQ